MAPTSTPRSLRSQAPATDPQMGCGAVAGGQMALGFPVGDVGDHLSGIYSALAETVDEQMGGVVAFAALLEAPIPDVSRRLRRADDGKGNAQRAPVDYLAALATSHAARLTFVNKLCAAWSLKPTEQLRALTERERADILSGALSDKTKRQLEREQGLPSGVLG